MTPRGGGGSFAGRDSGSHLKDPHLAPEVDVKPSDPGSPHASAYATFLGLQGLPTQQRAPAPFFRNFHAPNQGAGDSRKFTKRPPATTYHVARSQDEGDSPPRRIRPLSPRL